MTSLRELAELLGRPGSNDERAKERARNIVAELSETPTAGTAAEGLSLRDGVGRVPGILAMSDDGTKADALIRLMAEHISRDPSYAEGLLGARGALAAAVLGEEEVTVDGWRRYVLLSAAVVEAVSERAVISVRARELLVIAQWNLFLALSAPLRADADGPWTVDPGYDGVNRLVDIRERNIVEVFSRDAGAGARYLARLRDVRAALIDAFQHFQDNAELRQTHALDLDRAARLLVFDDVHAARGFTVPFNLREHLGGPKAAGDPELLVDLSEGFFLPRFDLRTMWRAVRASGVGAGWLTVPVAGILLLAAAAAAFVCGWQLWPAAPATWTVLAIAASAAVFLPLAVAPRGIHVAWMLRMPASVSIGAVLLVTLASQWWRDAYRQVGWHGFLTAIILLLSLAAGYVFVEARGHEVDIRTAIGRSLSVLGLVLLHAVLVALVLFGVIFPLFADGASASGGFQGRLDAEGAWERMLTLALAASFMAVVGLFSQVLWDEKAITTPLAHTRWRRGA